MARFGENNAFWPTIMEKAAAKLSGNYEYMSGGWFEEGMRLITGAPAKPIKLKGQNADKLWTELKGYDSKKYIMGAATEIGSGNHNSKTSVGLSYAHQYTLIGCYETGGKKLYKLRNPWKKETYKGNWHDGDSKWTSSMKSAVGFTSNTNDGIFFVEHKDFPKYFAEVGVSFYSDKGKISHYQAKNHSGKKTSYTFSSSKKEDLFISVDTWNHRMYPPSCSNGKYNKIKVKVTMPNGKKETTTYWDQKGMETVHIPNADKGSYNVEVTATWASFAVKDYVVRVYSSQKVTIK